METLSSVEHTVQANSEAQWYDATTLSERIVSFPFLQPQEEDQLRIAARRLEQWRSQAAFTDLAVFTERLAMDAITEQELLALLAEPIEHLQQRLAVPQWIHDLEQALANYSSAEGLTFSEAEQEQEGKGPITLFDVFIPLVEAAKEALVQGIQKLSTLYQRLPFDPATVLDLFMPNLATIIQYSSIRTMILEMHISRMQKRLSGKTPEERFRNFMRQLCQKSQLRLFLYEYPVLARSLLIAMRHWADNSLEILQRLSTDWAEICATFSQGIDPGVLVAVRGGEGDTHRGGKSVTILCFSSGLQIVYKPRSLALDQHFQELLIWVNGHGITLPLRTITILDKENYGWSEFVLSSSCTSEEEVAHFYRRQGSYLALLYALEACDFHYENIIAAGEHPVLIDLEALFHLRLELHDGATANRLATRSIGYSVLRTGLLPQRNQTNKSGEGIDLSGLGGQKGQRMPNPQPVWKERGTDQMHIVREYLESSGGKNRPKLHGNDVEVLPYQPYILEGFIEMYQILIEHREQCLTEILPRFEHDEVRVLLRHTRTYATLLFESFHPERLHDALERERLFDFLWYGIAEQPYLRRVIAAERLDLLQGDIPMFTTQPGSRDLITSRGERIVDFCAEPGMESVKKRIQQMDENDLAQQQWIIKAALVTTMMDSNQRSKPSLVRQQPIEVTSELLLRTACVAGDRLAELALRSERGVNWLGVVLAGEANGRTMWNLQAMGLKLYDGLSGVILFLSYLGALTGEQKYTDLARMALFSVQDLLDKQSQSDELRQIGAFSGLGSLIYLYSHLGALWHDNSSIRSAQEIVRRLDQFIDSDTQHDIISGSAGSIASLMSLYQVAPCPETLKMAIRCGEHLLATAQQMPEGIGWYTLGQQTAYTGFAHGGTGIALSLFKLAQVSQQERFHQAGMAALTYERSLFSPAQKNWARTTPISEIEYTSAWCYGAPGVGLGRLAMLEYLDNEMLRQEIDIALDTTIKQGFGQNQSLCHGDLGNLETLEIATQMLSEPRYHEELKRLTALVFSGIQDQGWVTGVPLGVETPGLMTGLAGIGYGLLRLAAPERIPSVLLLASPSGKI